MVRWELLWKAFPEVAGFPWLWILWFRVRFELLLKVVPHTLGFIGILMFNQIRTFYFL